MASTAVKVLVIAAVAGGLYAARPLWHRVADAINAARDPVAAAFLVEAERQGIRDSLVARFTGSSNQGELQQATMELARRGIGRLPGDLLAERASILWYLDSQAGDSLCASRFMGTMAPDGMRPYLAALDSARLSRWAALSVAALKAELLAPEPPELVTPGEARATLAAIEAAATPSDRYRLEDILTSLDKASPADQCWASTTITSLALSLPEPGRTEVLTKLARIEATH